MGSIFGDLNLSNNENVEAVDKSLIDQLPEELDETGNPLPFDPNKQAEALTGAQLDNQEVFDDTVNKEYGESLTPISAQEQDDKGQGEFIDPQMFSRNMAQDFGQSLARGTGTVIGGLGDLFQAGGGALGSAFGDPTWWQGNSLSGFFHGWGDEVTQAHQNYIPEEFKELTMSSLGSADGWRYLISNQVAETIPYMAEFVLSGFGAGSLAKGAASKIAKNAIKNYAKKGILKKTVRGVGRDGVEFGIKRNSIPNLLLNENGLSKGAAAVSHAFGAGAANNQMIAISQAAEAVNEAKLMQHEDGSKIFNDDELAEIGFDTYAQESAYIAADIASWAFTFGKLDKGLLRTLKLNKAPGVATTFGQKANKLIGKTAKVGFKAGVEGAEETIQEVYEEWAKKRSIEEAKLRKGLVSTNKYKGVGGFFDYYSSKETEGLRIVAGITGGLMAGGKASLDLMAEKSRLIGNKEELLKVRMPENADGEIQQEQIKAQRRLIADIVYDDRQNSFNETMKSWVDNGSMTEEDYQENLKQVNEFTELFEQSHDLSIEGADKLYYLTANKIDALKTIKKEKEILKVRLENAEKLGSTPEGIKGLKDQATAQYENVVAKHQATADQYIKAIENHILGKEFELSLDKDGNSKGFRGFKKSEYEAYTNTGKARKADRTVVDEAKETAENIKKKATDLVEDGKEVFNKGVDKVKEVLENYNSELTEESLAKRKSDSEILTDDEINSLQDEFDVTINNKDGAYQVNGPKEKEANTKLAEILENKKSKYEASLKESENIQSEIKEEVAKEEKGEAISEKFSKAFEKVKSTAGTILDKGVEKAKEVVEKVKSKKPQSTNENEKAAAPKEAVVEDSYEDSFQEFANDNETTSSKKEAPEKPKETDAGLSIEDDLSQPRDIQGRFKKVTAGEKTNAAVSKLTNKLKSIGDKLSGVLNSEELTKIKNDILNTKNIKDLSEAESNTLKSVSSKLEIQEKIQELKNKLSTVKIPKTKKAILNQIKSLTDSLVKKTDSPLKFNTITETLTSEQQEKLYSIDEIHSMDGLHHSPEAYSKLLVIRQNLGKKFPGIDINLVQDISSVVGAPTLGYAIGSAIYINSESVNQPVTIAHEASHVYYALTKNTVPTQRLLEFLLKNEKLVNKIKKDYWTQIIYEVSNEEGEQFFIDAETANAQTNSNFKNPKEFTEWLSQYGQVKEEPLSEQEVIKDEVFAFSMEKSITEEYDQYFNPRQKNKSNFLTKKFWQGVKSKLTLGVSKTDERKDAIDFLKNLDEKGIPTDEKHLRTFMLNKFSKGFKKTDFLPSLRGLKKIDPKEAKITETSMRKQKGVFNLNEKPIGRKFNTIADVVFGEEEDDKSNYETGNLDDKNPAYNKSISNMMNDFERDYNRKFYSKRILLDKNKLDHAIKVLASQSPNNANFIDSVQNSPSEELQQFNKWVKAFYGPDYRARLVSIHTSLSNNTYIPAVSIKSDSKTITIEPGLSQRDKNDVDRIMDNVQDQFDNYLSGVKNNQNKKLKTFGLNDHQIESLRAWDLMSKTSEDLFNNKTVSDEVLSSVLRNILGLSEIVPNLNQVVFNDGKPTTVKTALISLLKKGSRPSKNRNFRQFYFGDTRPFVKSLVAANKFTSGSTVVQNVEGNNISMYQKSNFAIAKLKEISRDIASDISEAKFNRKYNGNPLAMKMFKAKKIISLNLFTGSDIEGNTSLYKDGTKDSTFVNDFVFFLKGGAKSYMQSFPVSGDSPRRYYSSIPKIITTNLSEEQENEHYKKIAELAKLNGDTRFLDSNSKADFSKVKELVDNEVNKISKKFADNKPVYDSVFKKLDFKNQTSLINKNGNPTDLGNKVIKSYVVNHLANQSYIRDLFYPTVNEFDIAKRAKGSISPNTPINSTGKLKLGLIALKDSEFNSEAISFYGDSLAGKVNATDSMNIILPEDLERVKAIYGGTMLVGDILKFNNFGDEKDNKNFQDGQGSNKKGRGIYLKGLAFTLTDDFVKKYPKYKALRDTMRAQKDYYIKNHNKGQELSYNLNDGSKNFFPIAYALSGIKTGLTNEQRNNSVSLEELNDSDLAMSKINALNEYSTSGTGKGYGISGSNIGVQNLMDKQYDGSVFATQLSRNLYINASAYESLDAVESISSIMDDISYESVLKKVIKHLPEDNDFITDDDIKALKEFVVNNTNSDLIDPTTSGLLKKYSITLPYLQDRVSQIMKNVVVREGNKTYTSGGVGLQMSDYGFLEIKNGAVVNNDLKSYGIDAEGASYTDTKGNVRNATIPAESTIPFYLVEKNNIRLREYMQPSSAKAQALYIASQEASKLFKKDSKSYLDYTAKHTALLLGKDEKGSFVRGESYLGTRIPSHGLQTTLILEAKNSNGKGMGSAIIVPSELSAIMGSDLDGDAIYMNTSAKETKSTIDKKKEQLRLSTIDYMTNEAMQEDMMATLNMEEEKINTKNEIEELLGIKIDFNKKRTSSFTYPFLPTGQEESFNDNLQTRNLVGIAASLHGFLNVVSAYDTEFDFNLSIGDIAPVKSFTDNGTGIKARYYKTATLLNVILDNANEKMAEKIGITPATASQFILLAGMGYEIGTIAAIMNSNGAKAWIKSSENRNNPYYSESNKFNTLENARLIAGVKGAPADGNINIDLQNLNSEATKRNVIEMLNKLDTMQSELFKVNKILSGHKTLETNPFLLEKQLNEANDFLNGSGMLKYNERFRQNPLLKKYMRNHETAITIDEKTNIAFTKSNRKIVNNIQGLMNKDFSKKEFAIIKNKLMKVSLLRPMLKGYDIDMNTILDQIYGNEKSNTPSVFDELLFHKLTLSEDEFQNNELFKKGLVIVNQKNDKRISINPNLRDFGNDRLIKKIQEDFDTLPDEGNNKNLSLKDRLIIYDFIENGFKGKNSIFPLFDDSTIDFFQNESDNILKRSNSLMNKSDRGEIENKLIHSLHTIIPKIDYKKIKYNPSSKNFSLSNSDKQDLAKPGSNLFNQIVENKPFIKSYDHPGTESNPNNIKGIIEFQPLTESEILDIALKNGVSRPPRTISDFDNTIQQGIVNRALFKAYGSVNKNLLEDNDRPKRESPLYKDINLLTYKQSSGPNTDPKKKVEKLKPLNKNINTGRARLEGSENYIYEMSEEEFKTRNGLTNISSDEYTQEEFKKAFRTYKAQYKEAKAYSENLTHGQLKSMPDSTLENKIKYFYEMQAEAAAIISNRLRNELGIRESQKQSAITKVTGNRDLTKIQKWFISSNIPSKLPGLQRIAKKVNENYKSFLRERGVKYNEIKAATKSLYEEKYGKSLLKYNPFKNKDYYERLYGNLVVKELVGKGVSNIRLKDEEVVNAEFASGKITKAEKDFYDVFKSITNEYSEGLSPEQRRRGYIPHTGQSLYESYSNRGMLGVFMNSQSNEMKMNDVILKGYDPIKGYDVTQTFKEFKDAYDAISRNQEEGNRNKLQTRKIFMITKRAERLAKKNINENGTPIRISNVQIDTLLNGGIVNRFTNSRSNKSTEFPSMDLNKALMDYTHSSIFNKNFKDMLPEVDALITYYKNIGNDNAVEVIEKYYKGKILQGKAPESVLGKTGDKALRALNAFTVFKLLGFNTAIVSGNVLAGKYHNIKNNGGKSWIKGEKRFWGLHNLEKSGIKGVFKEFRKSMELLNKLGFMEQNVYEELSLEKEWNPITKLQNLAFLPMTLSEKWIQGVQFLGQLSDEEWKDWVDNGKLLSLEKQSEYENIVKGSQGRGYNYTDQRLVSLYSLGQSLMMFSRFIPTMMQDRFGAEDVDAYGKKYIGSLNQFGKTAADVISGRMKLSEYNDYKKSLPQHKQEALTGALNGMGLVTLIGLFGAGAGALGDDETERTSNKLIADANYAINLPKFVRKTNLPIISSTKEIINSISNRDGQNL